jgi:tetratricopeptide (TPR) repeat protein
MNVAKIVVGVALLLVTGVGLWYWSLLSEMNQAVEDYRQGDAETALSRYENVESKIRGVGLLRFMPTGDRQDLFLNQGRLHYDLGNYDEAAECLERENEIAGLTTDGRFFLLRGDISFRKAVSDYRESERKDAKVLEDAFRSAEDNLRDSMRLIPDDWDAKFNYEFINYVRRMMNQNEDEEQIKILMENVRVKQTQPQALPPDQQS